MPFREIHARAVMAARNCRRRFVRSTQPRFQPIGRGGDVARLRQKLLDFASPLEHGAALATFRRPDRIRKLNEGARSHSLGPCGHRTGMDIRGWGMPIRASAGTPIGRGIIRACCDPARIGAARRPRSSRRPKRNRAARPLRITGLSGPESLPVAAPTRLRSAEPVPDAFPPTWLSSSSRDIRDLGFSVAGLSRPNLLLGPSDGPTGMTFLDDVVAPAWQSPVADRRRYADGLAIVFDAPLATPQRQADFRAAAAGAQMLRQSVLHRYVEIAGLERWRHVIDPDRGHVRSSVGNPLRSWRSRPVEAETSMVSMSRDRSFR